MTGIYVRMKRQKKWMTLEIEQLTGEELSLFLSIIDWKDDLIKALLKVITEKED